MGTEPRVVDARWLEPPEPMVRVMDALDTLKDDEELLFLLHREPRPLYQILIRNGFSYRVAMQPDGCFGVYIRRSGDVQSLEL